MNDSSDSVSYRVAGNVACVELHRPHLMNALDEAMLGQLRVAMESAGQDTQVRAVLLSAAGRGFCAGAALADSADLSLVDAGETLRRFYNPLILGMRQLPKPIVVAVNGAAAGAGLGLALAGDVVLASRSATFYAAFARVGLVPDAGSSYFLPRAIGDARSRALLMLAECVDATEAQRLGLVWQVFEPEALYDAALQMAERLACMPTRALALIKEALEAGAHATLAEQLETEAQGQTIAARTADFAEGVAAFLAKRAPVFTGY